MKKLFADFQDKNGTKKTVSVLIDDQTAAVLEQCSEEFRQLYLLEEHAAYNRTRAETRRHTSYEAMLEELGHDIPSDEESPAERIIRLETYARLHNAQDKLTDKQAMALHLIAVDGLSFHAAGEIMGIRWETVREHYEAAIQKMKKYF